MELSDVIVDSEDDEAGADSETGGDQEMFAETDPGEAEGKDRTEDNDRSLDPHGDVVIQRRSRFMEDVQGVCNDGVVSRSLKWGGKLQHCSILLKAFSSTNQPGRRT